ncbi:MAG: glycoside hydrolase family 43 protein [Kofleriaceae bacterium]|nr:glycoside hydrolase family 43 protein [Kofleriaceae bacterium]
MRFCILVLLAACSAAPPALDTHFTNPVIPGDCPDPGVLRDGSQYVLTCTSGDAADAFPIYTSRDLVRWSQVSHVFPRERRPGWAIGDFWAPEIHKIGDHYVAYYTARDTHGMLAIGAAYGPSATGPFVDLGAPLVTDATMGLIDASAFTASDGTSYLLWKEDGNATGQPTDILAQQLEADGLALVGAPAKLISNDEPWEGAVTEAPFMVERDGMFYLFYSGNSYADATYAVGVARGSSPLGPMTKLGAPILSSAGGWAGPGHCSVVNTFAGKTAVVYHAWRHDCVNGPSCGRATLLDFAQWGTDGWPNIGGTRPATAVASPG